MLCVDVGAFSLPDRLRNLPASSFPRGVVDFKARRGELSAGVLRAGVQEARDGFGAQGL